MASNSGCNFNSKSKHLPDSMFNVGFEIFPMVGGDIFAAESDLTILRDCMDRAGDEHFAVVQNRNVVVGNYDAEDSFTRFKYPIDISWVELMSGGIIGSEHFKNGCKNYFVFGDSGYWGRYVANSWIKKQFSKIFRQNFEKIRQLEPEITPEILFSEWLPDSYK